MITDKRALKILFDTYWSPKGWLRAGDLNWEPKTPPEDLDYAMRAGVMFPSRTCEHDEAVARVRQLRSQIDPSDVGRAFIATLSSNQPGLRSALGSYAIALHMPSHAFVKGKLWGCEICGDLNLIKEHDLSVMNFERHKWGGVRHLQPVYIAFDLERFIEEPSPTPTSTDEKLLNDLLGLISSMPEGAKLAQLLKATTGVIPGNKDQRRKVIDILGYAGVLTIPGRSGFFREFTKFSEREETPWYKDDWPYPTQWWRGGHAVDAEAVALWFGTSVVT